MRRLQEWRRRRRLRGGNSWHDRVRTLPARPRPTLLHSAITEEEDIDEETEEELPNNLGLTLGFGDSYEVEQDAESNDAEVELREAFDDEDLDCERLHELLERAKSCYWRRRLEIQNLPKTSSFQDHLKEFQQRELNEALGEQIVRAQERLKHLEQLEPDEETFDAGGDYFTTERSSEQESLEDEERTDSWQDYIPEDGEEEEEVAVYEEVGGWEANNRQDEEGGGELELYEEVEDWEENNVQDEEEGVEVELHEEEESWQDYAREDEEEEREVELNEEQEAWQDYAEQDEEEEGQVELNEEVGAWQDYAEHDEEEEGEVELNEEGEGWQEYNRQDQEEGEEEVDTAFQYSHYDFDEEGEEEEGSRLAAQPREGDSGYCILQ